MSQVGLKTDNLFRHNLNKKGRYKAGEFITDPGKANQKDWYKQGRVYNIKTHYDDNLKQTFTGTHKGIPVKRITTIHHGGKLRGVWVEDKNPARLSA